MLCWHLCALYGNRDAKPEAPMEHHLHVGSTTSYKSHSYFPFPSLQPPVFLNGALKLIIQFFIVTGQYKF